MTAICIGCQREMEYTALVAFPGLRPKLCDKCKEAALAREEQRLLSERVKHFEQLCPPLYLATDINHPDMLAAKNREAILGWKFQPKGIIAHGPTRHCKTRLLWLLVKRLMEEGRSVLASTAGQFARECAENAGNDSQDWFAGIVKADVLFIDDLGKQKFTERAAADLFEAIEARAANLKPCLFTTNFVGKELAAQMSADRGDAIVSRIREFCHAYTV